MRKAEAEGHAFEESYYVTVESYFVERRGGPLFITPGEWQLVWRWEQQGIPLAVVKEGIDRVFERPRTSSRPRRLGYCRQTVEAAFRRHREAALGARSRPRSRAPDGSDEEEARGVPRHLIALAETLESLDSGSAIRAPGLGGVLHDVTSRLRGMAEAAGEAAAVDRLEEELAALEERLLDAAEQALDEGDRRRLRAEAEASLASYRERMPEKVYLAALRSAYRRRLRSAFGLIRLSLLDR